MNQKITKFLQKIPRRTPKKFEGLCPNCEHPVDGKFCSNCGQSIKDFRQPFFSVLTDSLGDALSFDNRLLHTMIPLFVKPGFLTKEFMRGRRARYTPPFRLYLFLTFFAFLLLSHNHKPETDSQRNLSFQTDEGENIDVLSFFEEYADKDSLEMDSIKELNLNENGNSLRKSASFGTTLPGKNKSFKVSGLNIGNEKFKKLIDMWKLDPLLMMDTAFKKLSQTLLLILPLFALLLALLYIRRKHYLLEHLLISLNFHSFVFVIVIVSELLIMLNVTTITNFAYYLYLLIPFQLFLAMKFYYGQSWIKTIFKFLILSFFYNILLFAGLLYSLVSLVA